MPEQYLKMRDSFISKGMSSKAAKGKAARIYNSKNPKAPVGPGYDAKVAKKKKARKKRKPMSSKMGGYIAA